MGEGDGFAGILIGTISMAVVLFLVFFFPIHDKMVELGESICNQEYNMVFDSYNDRELKCKPMPEQESYDGIIIQIQEGVVR